MGILRPDVRRGLDGAGVRPEEGAALLKAANYKGDPIPFRVLNNYYTNQVATAQIQVEMWRASGSTSRSRCARTGSRSSRTTAKRAMRDWSNSAPFSDPMSSMVGQHGPQGQQQQAKEWTNDEMNKLCGTLETEVDMAKRKAMFKRMLEICEREDPAYTVLHQNATFTAKRKDIAVAGGAGLRHGLPRRQFPHGLRSGDTLAVLVRTLIEYAA